MVESTEKKAPQGIVSKKYKTLGIEEGTTFILGILAYEADLANRIVSIKAGSTGIRR